VKALVLQSLVEWYQTWSALDRCALARWGAVDPAIHAGADASRKIAWMRGSARAWRSKITTGMMLHLPFAARPPEFLQKFYIEAASTGIFAGKW